MKQLHRMLEIAGPSSAPVLLVGESGTGKELAARRLHQLSSRADGPFVAVNCGAVTESLFEAELFGHEKGAFTGANERRPGYFELADGGTLFLDELDAMPVSGQVKLLRALEEKSFRRLRGRDEVRVDVRVAAAMGTEPDAAIERGVLREDLYYRLNVFTLRLPPLRERTGDIVFLARYFADCFGNMYEKPSVRISGEAQRMIVSYSWPGNVRELRNAIEHGVVLVGEDGLLDVSLLPARVRRGTADAEVPSEERRGDVPLYETRSVPASGYPVGMSLEEASRGLILATLEANGYNRTRSAKMLGVSVKTIYNKLREWSSNGDLQAERAQSWAAHGRCQSAGEKTTGSADLVSIDEARRRRTG